jgi:hypothetical protein
MRILIDFGDNDFYVTFTETLRLFNNYIKTKNIKDKEITKELIIDFFNENTDKVYWVLQNEFKYNTNWNAKSYLKIGKGHIYLEDDIDYKIDSTFGNGEMFVLDTETDEIYDV